MKYLMATGAAIFFFQISSGFASSCRLIEYAEVKHTSTANLVTIYCLYTEDVKIEREFLAQARKLYGSGSGIDPVVKKAISKHTAEMNQCLETQKKILSALESRGETSALSCT